MMYSSSAVCSAKGYSGAQSRTYNGRTLTDMDVSNITTLAMNEHQAEFPRIPMGCDHHTYEKAVKRRKAAAVDCAKQALANELGIPKWKLELGIVAGAILLFLSPLAFFVAVAVAVVEWNINNELDTRE